MRKPRTEREIRSLVARVCRSIGEEEMRHLTITPKDGGWHDAMTYELKRRDGRLGSIWSSDIEDENEAKMRERLEDFLK